MSFGSAFSPNGRIHALTMLAYYRDAQKTARPVVGVFAVIAVIEGVLYLTSEHPAFGFGALASLIFVVFGAWSVHHHGKRVADWEQTLHRIDQQRRDATIHAIAKATGELS